MIFIEKDKPYDRYLVSAEHKNFWRWFDAGVACALVGNTAKAHDELGQTIKKLGKNLNLFEDRVALASAAQDKGDLEGAVVEYQAALNLKKDQEISLRLEKAQLALGNRRNDALKVEH